MSFGVEGLTVKRKKQTIAIAWLVVNHYRLVTIKIEAQN
jgi:hypothetical protein